MITIPVWQIIAGLSVVFIAGMMAGVAMMSRSVRRLRDKVRELHRILYSPPPTHWNCRCVYIPMMDSRTGHLTNEQEDRP